MPLPTYSHGHFGYHSTYGHEQTKGVIPNNYKNYNDLVERPAGSHGYFKPSFCHWPTGGYTRKEVQHTHRQGEFDVGPQSFEFSQFYRSQDVGVLKRARESDLQVVGSRSEMLTEASLKDWLSKTTTGKPFHPKLSAAQKARPQSAPSERSEKTNSTLALGIFSQTKGTAFEPQPKPAPWSTPSFAQFPPKPKDNGPAAARAIKRQVLGQSVCLWEDECARQIGIKNSPAAPNLNSSQNTRPTDKCAARVAEARAVSAPPGGKTRVRPSTAHAAFGSRTRLIG